MACETCQRPCIHSRISPSRQTSVAQRVQNKFSRIQADRFDGCRVRFVNCVVHDVTDPRAFCGKDPAVSRLARCNPASVKHTTNTRCHRHGPRSGDSLRTRYNEHGALRVNKPNILPPQAEAFIGSQTRVENYGRNGFQRLRAGVEVSLLLLGQQDPFADVRTFQHVEFRRKVEQSIFYCVRYDCTLTSGNSWGASASYCDRARAHARGSGASTRAYASISAEVHERGDRANRFAILAGARPTCGGNSSGCGASRT